MISDEVVLAVLEGDEENRTLLVHLHRGANSLVELRQQSWGEGVGWYTQSSVQLQTEQVAQLRVALGGNGKATSRVAAPVAGGFVPRLVRADSA